MQECRNKGKEGESATEAERERHRKGKRKRKMRNAEASNTEGRPGAARWLQSVHGVARVGSLNCAGQGCVAAGREPLDELSAMDHGHTRITPLATLHLS